ncbi:hypothetical protein F2Q70_00045158 [Brassica cretica]|uniref:HVA22-like protein n=1 Tax=Brassica cretica TaxID=69181 RepID=A0A8S9KD44_BRACR|nr:hypothetical protein F2Q70_00045158 [Brassica cretica]
MLRFRDEGGRHLFLPWTYGSVLGPRFPIWPFLKLVGICWLVLPQFNGAEHVYRHFIRPFYMNPQRASTNIWYVPQKKFNFFPKRDDDDILTAAEKYMEKHGTDAFERMIVRKDSYERGRRGGGGGSNNYMIFDDDYSL